MGDKLKINDNSFLFCDVGNKHSVYYVDEKTVKSFEAIQTAVDARRLVEKLDRKTGQKRYIDYDESKWLRVN